MTFKEIKKEIIDALALELEVPARYFSWDEGSAPAPPYIIWYYDGADDFFADNLNYKKIRTLIVEFYSEFKDIAAEETIESFFFTNYLTYNKETESYIASEKLYQTVYAMEVIIDG